MKATSRELAAQQYIKGKTIVITGATSGVGRAAALAFARYAPKLVLAARRTDVLEEVSAECRELGADVQAVTVDTTNAETVTALAAAANAFGGRIDVWINNAGVLAAGTFEEVPLEIHEQVLRTNLMGYMHGAYAVLPYFKQQKEGILINNISIGGFMPVPYAAAYSASKFGLRGFSEALNGELRDYKDIKVCELYPPFLDTPGIQHAANYTGRHLKPAPPVSDPVKIAEAMVDTVLRPKRSQSLGWVSLLLRFGHAVAPDLIVGMTAKVMDTYFQKAHLAPATSGNVLEPVDYGSSIHGGWSLASKPDKKATINGLVIAGGTALLYALTRARKKKKTEPDWD